MACLMASSAGIVRPVGEGVGVTGGRVDGGEGEVWGEGEGVEVGWNC